MKTPDELRDLKQRIMDAFYIKERDDENNRYDGEPMMICPFCGRLKMRCFKDCTVCGEIEDDPDRDITMGNSHE